MVKYSMSSISSLYVCIVNIKLKHNFVETPRKFIMKMKIRAYGYRTLCDEKLTWCFHKIIYLIMSNKHDPILNLKKNTTASDGLNVIIPARSLTTLIISMLIDVIKIIKKHFNVEYTPL